MAPRTLWALAAAVACASASPSFIVSNNSFLKDGAPFTLLSGSFHYPRAIESTWRDRLLRMKAMGLNAVQTYSFWNYHEKTATYTDEPIFDFSGPRNVSAFLQTCAEVGLLVLFRAGPYGCGEWDFGGLPPFLLSTPGISGDNDLRTNNSVYLSYVDRWWTRLAAEVRPHLYSNGGAVIMWQLENEYGSYGSTGSNPADLAYMIHLRETARTLLGQDAVLLYTTDGGDVGYLKGGAVPEVLATGDGGCGDTCHDFFAAEDQFNPAGMRVHTDSEFYTGWLTHWGEAMANTSTSGAVGGVATLLAEGGSVNLYMGFGGTNAGFTSGANGGGADFQPVITSYDYNSPIQEGGGHGYGPGDGDKFQAFLQLFAYWSGVAPAPEPPAPAVTAYGSVTMSSGCPLLSVVSSLAGASAAHGLAAPLTMEALGQRHGYALYASALPAGATPGKAAKLVLAGLADRAEAFVGGASAGVTYRPDTGAGTISVAGSLVAPGAQLGVLVENCGHINYGRSFFDPQGLTGARWGGAARANWSQYPLELSWPSIAALPFAPLPVAAGPAFYRGSLTIAGAPTDTYVSLCGWGKGTLWINGHHIGRYWSIGPQFAFYVPAAFLSQGANDIVVLEQHAANAATSISFGSLPDFTGKVCGKAVAPLVRSDGRAAGAAPAPAPTTAPSCRAPAAGMQLTLQSCADAPSASTGLTWRPVGPAAAHAGVWALTAAPSLCVAAMVGAPQQPLALAACDPADADRSQHWLWFETPSAAVQPPAPLMSLGALGAVGKCFDVTGGGGAPGQAVGLYGCTAGTNQAWSQAAPAGGLVSEASGLCLAAC